MNPQRAVVKRRVVSKRICHAKYSLRIYFNFGTKLKCHGVILALHKILCVGLARIYLLDVSRCKRNILLSERNINTARALAKVNRGDIVRASNKTFGKKSSYSKFNDIARRTGQNHCRLVVYHDMNHMFSWNFNGELLQHSVTSNYARFTCPALLFAMRLVFSLHAAPNYLCIIQQGDSKKQIHTNEL